jgi:hypothetical protein
MVWTRHNVSPVCGAERHCERGSLSNDCAAGAAEWKRPRANCSLSRGAKNLQTIHVLDRPEEILRDPQTLDKTQTPVAERMPAPLGDYVFASTGFTVT